MIGTASVGLLALPLGGCRREATVAVAPLPAPDLELRASEETRSAGATAERIGDALRGVAHEEDEGSAWPLQLDAGYCYWFGYAGDAQVKRFSMYLWDPSHKRQITSRGKAPHGVVAHCATQPGIYKVEGKVREGRGHFAIVVSRTKMNGAATTTTTTAAAAPAAADLDRTIEQQAAALAPGARRVGDFVAGAAESADFYAAMDAGKCYWLVGAGETHGVKRLSLFLWDPKGRRVADNKSESAHATVGHCATETGMYKFQARVDRGSGPYKIGIYAR